MPVFPLLNATVRIIEPLATTFRKELLSDRPLVRTQPGVPKMTAVSRFLMVYSGFLLPFLLNGLAAPPERFYTFSAVSLLIGFEHFFRVC